MADEEREPIAKPFIEAIQQQVREELMESLAADRSARRKMRGRAKPEGIVTIVFTDIEDSSGLVARLGDEPARALVRQHDELLREIARANEGVEVERAGDGFMIAFSTASRAIAFAVDLQLALARHPRIAPAGIRVRVGIETGEAIAEEQGYFGRTVFQASRIADLAEGGQIIVSEATRLIASPGTDIRDLGDHELKGLGGPFRLHEVAWASEE